MKRYTLNSPLSLRPVSAERSGYGLGLAHFDPLVELPGNEANPLVEKGELLILEENKDLPPALDTEVRVYRQVVNLPDDIAKIPLRKGVLNLLEEPKAAPKKVAVKKSKTEVKEEAK